MSFQRISLLLIAVVAVTTNAFSTTAGNNNIARISTTALQVENNDFMNWARASRSAQSEDKVVELKRPLGVVLNQDAAGNVYVEDIAPKGNAARSGNVKVGDIVTMCSATFGDDMWSTRGVGLNRVLAAIRVRAGSTVKLVLESATASKKKQAMTTAQLKAQDDAREAAQKKKDSLLNQLEEDEVRLTGGKKKFFGLF